MAAADLIAALLLPLPPWLGFWLFRRKGRVGLSYGYFLGGILAVLGLPWAHLTGLPLPAAHLGGALLGFTLFLQAQREGVQGVRRLAVGVGGASLFLVLLLVRLRLPWQDVAHLWAGAALEGLLWLVLSDLAYRWTGGRKLEVRMPLVGAAALALGTLAQHILPPQVPRLPWTSALLGGLLLGLVALQQLRWLREQGAWVEGRGQGLRVALALVEKQPPAELPGLAFGLEAHQPLWLVDDQGRILESNGPFGRLVGLPRHRLRGYALDALFQGGDLPVWAAVRDQLLRFGCATVPATQVSEDGTFRTVTLQASTFDRGMALLWLADPTPGTLVLRGGGHPQTGDEAGRRDRLNALLSLDLSLDHLAAQTPEGPLRRAAGQARSSAARLDPPQENRVPVEASAALETLLPDLARLAPPEARLILRAPALPLAVSPDLLARLATNLLLQALTRTGRRAVELNLILEEVSLGGRRFGLLSAEASPESPRAGAPGTGFGWLRQAVSEAGGLLELTRSGPGLRPRIYLPLAGERGPLAGPLLEGRTLALVDQDPLVRQALADLVTRAGGEARAHEDLPSLLRASHQHAADLLVLERTPQLERFQQALRKFQKDPLPTLVLGLGEPLPLDPGSLGLERLGFLEKPFRSEAFLRAALALLRRTGA